MAVLQNMESAFHVEIITSIFDWWDSFDIRISITVNKDTYYIRIMKKDSNPDRICADFIMMD